MPGAEIVVGAMGLLFEAGKLTSFAMLHRRSLPRLLRGALATVGLTLMTANVAGVSGFLSNELRADPYQRPGDHPHCRDERPCRGVAPGASTGRGRSGRRPSPARRSCGRGMTREPGEGSQGSP
jgi:hypothetical protein